MKVTGRRSRFDCPCRCSGLLDDTIVSWLASLRAADCWPCLTADAGQGDTAMNDTAHPFMRDVPVGIAAVGQRHETDSMGGIDVPADRYWGAQTQRSLLH